MASQRKQAMKGFTLIELVIVIAVIAILAALLVPTILNQTQRARESRAKNEVAEIAKTLARMRADTDATTAACYDTLADMNSVAVPANCGSTLPTCTTSNIGHVCWNGPYMSQPVNNDPWDHPYIVTYTAPANGQSVGEIQVVSFGPDGVKQIADTTDCTTSSDDLCAIQ